MPISDGWNNLVPLASRSPEEQKRIRGNGARASARVQKRKKNLKELANVLLENPVQTKEAKQAIKALFPNVDEEEMTNGLGMLAKIMLSALTTQELKEAVKAAEFLRDTSGQKPDVKITADENMRTVFVNEKDIKEVDAHIDTIIKKEKKPVAKDKKAKKGKKSKS